MDQLLQVLEKQYMDRVRNMPLQKDAWKRFAAHYNPHKNYTGSRRPSLKLARYVGDLGMSLLWIVQASLIRGLLKEIRETGNESGPASILKDYEGTHISALAHSEARSNPVIIGEKDGRLILSGEKKFITGGSTADYIFLTGRTAGETGISRMVIVPVAGLPGSIMPELDLNALFTVTHSRLLMDELVLDRASLIPMESRTLRRTVKIWGIIERSMILEAFLGYCIYLKDRLGGMGDMASLSDTMLAVMLKEQEEIVSEQIQAIQLGNRIEEKIVDIQKLIDITGIFSIIDKSHIQKFPEELQYRLKDLQFFGKFFS